MFGVKHLAPAGRSPSEVSRGKIVVNGDDFGRTSSVNRGVIRAHREGVLTSASLMVGAAAAEEAVGLARETPTLAVGLHLVLSQDLPVLPAAEVDALTVHTGAFHPSPVAAGLAFLSRRSVRQLRHELRAQFACFAKTGLALSHVDGHMHLHMHPSVFPLVLELAEEYGAAAIRLPREPWTAIVGRGAGRIRSIARVECLRLLTVGAVDKVRERGMMVSDFVLGISRSGAMTTAYVIELLRRISTPLIELIFHPADGPRIDDLGPNPGDLRTLLDPRLRQIIFERNLELADFTRLKCAGLSGLS